jgi:hypothetical protein
MTDAPRLLPAARCYASRGRAVFPVVGKVPMTAHGFKDATSDIAQIESWDWERATGVAWAVQAPLFVLDVDPRHRGEESLDDLEREHGRLPVTRAQRTGGGGSHLIFKAPPGVEVRQLTAFRPGLDTRAPEKGYVLLSPSVHPDTGLRYCWRTRAPVAEAPTWLVELVRVPPARPAEKYTPTTTPDMTARRARYAAAVLAGEARAVAENGRGRQEPPTEQGVVAVRPVPGRARSGTRRPRTGGRRPRCGAGRARDRAGASVSCDDAPLAAAPRPAADKRRERVLPVSALVDRLRDPGPRVATGIRTLDRASRGGLRRGRRVFVLGAPSTAKTTLAMTLALKWARDGHRVVWLAVDEEAADLVVRLGQMLGFDRDLLEAGDVPELERLQAALAALPGLTILDADDGHTIEDAIDVLEDRPPNVAGALFVDSLQSAAEAMLGDGPRARVDAVVRGLRRASRRGLIVIATCEMSRGAYRSRNPADRIDPMAAGKESGSIEYAAKTQLVLTEVPDRTGEIDVTIRKNRGGSKEPFRLRVDFKRARVDEVDMPTDDAEVARDPEVVWNRYETIVRTKLAEHPAGLGGGIEKLAKLVKLRAGDAREAIRRLIDRGEIRVENGSRGSKTLHLVDSRPSRSTVVPPSSGTCDDDYRPLVPSLKGDGRRDEGRGDGRGRRSSREPGEDDGDEEDRS